jgi:hypothetical protein
MSYCTLELVYFAECASLCRGPAIEVSFDSSKKTILASHCGGREGKVDGCGKEQVFSPEALLRSITFVDLRIPFQSRSKYTRIIASCKLNAR